MSAVAVSPRQLIVVLALSVTAFLLGTGTATALAGKSAEAVIGGPQGTTGGLFSSPADVAVNHGTGQIYVADRGNNRIQRFDSARNFERAFGSDVVQPGGTGEVLGNERQMIAVNATGGTFKLGFPNLLSSNTTGDLPFDASSATIQVALEELPELAPGDVLVNGPDGGPWTVEFQGTRGDTDPPQIRSIGNLTGGAPGPIVTTVVYGSGLEICSVASECQAGGNNAVGGGLELPEELAINQTSGHVYVSDRLNRVSEFDADGHFVRLWGAGVVKGGGTGDIPTNERQRVSPMLFLEPDGGSFALRFRPPGGLQEQTAQIAISSTASQVETALEDLPSLEPTDVAVSGTAGGPWEVEFTGLYADTDVSEMSVDNTKLTQSAGGSTFQGGQMDVETTMAAGGFEVCTIPVDCVPAAQGSGAGQSKGASSNVAPLDTGPSGQVFLGDMDNARVNEYEEDGEFVRSWGWGVDTDADAFEICTAASSCEAGRLTDLEAPAKNGQFARGSQTAQPEQLAVDAAGIVYASDVEHRAEGLFGFGSKPRILRFDSAASNASSLLLPEPILSIEPNSGAAPGPLPTGPPSGLESDRNGGNLFYSSGSSIHEIEPTAPASRHATHLEGSTISLSGIGHDPSSDRLFGATSSSGHRVVIAGETGIASPDVAMEQPEVLDESSAVFRGKVTPGGPDGLETYYRFEYKKVSQATWTKLPTSDVDLGDGADAIEVTQSVSTLEPGVAYEVRLVARKAFGASEAVGGPETILLGDLPPAVQTLYPQQRSATSATLSGMIDPQNRATTYRFEWGTGESYDNQAPLPHGTIEGDEPTPVAVQISGLQPETEYRYRLVADNGAPLEPGCDVTAGECETEVVGAAVDFETRPSPSSQSSERDWEMVTPAFKSQPTTTNPFGSLGSNANPGIPSLDGETLAWQSPVFPLDDTDIDFSSSGDQRLFKRTGTGWVAEALNTLPLLDGLSPRLMRQLIGASSADLLTQPVYHSFGPSFEASGSLLPTEGTTANRFYTRRPGTGVEGWTPWLSNPDQQVPGLPDDIDSYNVLGETSLVDDAATAMVRGGDYFDLAEDAATPAEDDPSDVSVGGVYLQRAADPDDLPTARKQVVNACTGQGPAATQLPGRIGDGSSSDVIGVRPCESGEAIEARIGGDHRTATGLQTGEAPSGGPVSTALAHGGSRVFLTSPRPDDAVPSCTTGVGAATECPPQLFVRQLDSEGANPRLAWISRSRSISGPEKSYSGGLIENQRIDLLGSGAGFQGASRDGSVVYFKTNAPLTPDDPNGTGTPGPKTSGSASNFSWDLYRYDLPDDLDQDPAAGVLTRVSGGPTGIADASTNQAVATSNSISAGSGATLRYLSEDGDRAYFVTTSPIDGADVDPPTGGRTSPGGEVGNAETRNLYLFDAGKAGADRYRFIARLPYFPAGSSASGGNDARELNACASYSANPQHHLTVTGGTASISLENGNCFRATPDGSHIAFFTAGQLTDDDNDEAGDIYLYDVEADELKRVSAPAADAAPYACNYYTKTASRGVCNGDFGFPPSAFFSGTAGGHPESSRGYASTRYNNLAVDDDGVVSVFFESRSELLPEDKNGNHWDVYEWREGELSLLSRAMPERHTYYSGNSLDGEDLFVFTNDRIDPREISPFDYDLYDYRSGGGFPYTPPPTPCDVLALQCEANANPAPPIRAPQTLAVGPFGSVTRDARRLRCTKGKVRRSKRCLRAGAIARKRCRKLRGRMERRCVRKQARRVKRVERQRIKRARQSANATKRGRR